MRIYLATSKLLVGEFRPPKPSFSSFTSYCSLARYLFESIRTVAYGGKYFGRSGLFQQIRVGRCFQVHNECEDN